MHYENAKDINSYLHEIPQERVATIKKLIQMVRKIAPKVDETFQHGMPFYPLRGTPLFALASQKHYMAIYITEHDLVEKYKGILGKVSMGKSCIRFRKEDHLDWKALEALLSEAYQRRIGQLID